MEGERGGKSRPAARLRGAGARVPQRRRVAKAAAGRGAQRRADRAEGGHQRRAALLHRAREQGTGDPHVWSAGARHIRARSSEWPESISPAAPLSRSEMSQMCSHSLHNSALDMASSRDAIERDRSGSSSQRSLAFVQIRPQRRRPDDHQSF